MPQLTIEDLIVAYGDVVAVKGVSFSVEKGEFVSLLGPSGCGKTTTLRCIAGLEPSAGGTIRIAGDLVAEDGREVPPEKRGINMVFQSYAVWPHMTVFENVAYGLRTRREPLQVIRTKVGDALNMVGLAGYADRYGTELSGGQQQRIALARAIVTSPELLLFDEPLSNLDAGLRDRMRFELVELQRRLGTTSLYVTHDQSEAMLMSDRIILMQDGLMVQSGTPRDLYYRPINRFAAEFIGNANILEAEIVKRDGNNAQVRLPGGAVLEGQFCWPEHRRDDGTTLAVIRAESIDTGPAAANTLKATVRSVSFVGPSVSCMLDLGGFSLRAELSARRPPAVGQTIDIHIDSEAVGFIAGH